MKTFITNRPRLFSAKIALAFVLVFSLASQAQAALLVLGVDTALSDFSAKLNLKAAVPLLPPINVTSPTLTANLFGAAPDPNIVPAITGFLGDVGLTGGAPGTPGQLDSDGGGFSFSDLKTTINVPDFGFGPGSLSLHLQAPHVNIEDAVSFLPTAAVNGFGTYDFAGLDLTVDGALLGYSSSGLLSFLGSGTTKILPGIAKVTLPPNSLGSLTLGAGPPNAIPATLEIPLNVTVPLFSLGNSTLGATGNVIFGGKAVFTGLAVVPEPGSIVLLGVGLLVAVPLAARRFRRA